MGPRLYCLNFGDNTISVYSVDGAGLITDLGAPFSPVTGLGTVLASGEGIVFDDANDILLVANQVPSSISAYGVLGGFLIPLPGSPFATGGSAPQAMAFVDDTPTQWLFTALGGSDEVAAHEYDLATPELDGVTGSPFDSVGEMPVDIAADD